MTEMRQEWTGTFAPPSVGTYEVPIPLAGDGRMRVGPNLLDVDGFRRPRNAIVRLVPVALVGGILLLGVVGAAFKIDVAHLRWWLIGGAMIGVLYRWLTAACPNVAKNAPPWALSIPWRAITKVEQDPAHPGGVVIHVEKFDPTGTIHFIPQTVPVATVIETIKPRIRSRMRSPEEV